METSESQAGARKQPLNLKAVSYASIKGWQKDNHLAAFKALLISCDKIVSRKKYYRSSTSVRRGLLSNCYKAQKLGKFATAQDVKDFFETHFQPYEVRSRANKGLLTWLF